MSFLKSRSINDKQLFKVLLGLVRVIFVFLALTLKNLNLITRTPFGVFHRESK